MNQIIKTVFSALFVTAILLPVAAHAQRNQNREHRQQGRIHEGVKSGELTKKEARRLHQGQKHVDRMQNRAESDGVVSAEEKAKLEKAQDRQSKAIYNQKHDEQKRDGAKPEATQPEATPTPE